MIGILVQFLLIDHLQLTAWCIGVPCIAAKVWIVYNCPSHPHYRGQR